MSERRRLAPGSQSVFLLWKSSEKTRSWRICCLRCQQAACKKASLQEFIWGRIPSVARRWAAVPSLFTDPFYGLKYYSVWVLIFFCLWSTSFIFLSKRFKLSWNYMCVFIFFHFISEDIPVCLALSYLCLKSMIYISAESIYVIESFLLQSRIDAPVRASIMHESELALYGTMEILLGDGANCRIEGTHRCCWQMLFLGISVDSDFKGGAVLWSSSSSRQPRVSLLHLFCLFSLLFPLLFLYPHHIMWRELSQPPAPALPLLILLPLCAYPRF